MKSHLREVPAEARSQALAAEETTGRRMTEEAIRTLMDLALDRVYGAAMQEVSWGEALAAVARAHGVDQAILFTPTVAVADGGLWAARDFSAFPDARVEHAYSAMLHDGSDSSVPATLFALFRANSAEKLNPFEWGMADITSRHLARAVRIWFHNRTATHGSEALAAALNAAAVILQRDGRVVWMNYLAEDWKTARRLTIDGGHLVAVKGYTEDLAQVIRHVVESNARVDATLPGDITLELVPVRMPRIDGVERGNGSGALLFLRDHVARTDTTELLMLRYHLTRAEADLALALWGRTALEEYAERRSVTLNTVRSQLKALLSKTGSRRQSDIVSIVARLRPMVSR